MDQGKDRGWREGKALLLHRLGEGTNSATPCRTADKEGWMGKEVKGERGCEEYGAGDDFLRDRDGLADQDIVLVPRM